MTAPIGPASPPEIPFRGAGPGSTSRRSSPPHHDRAPCTSSRTNRLPRVLRCGRSAMGAGRRRGVRGSRARCAGRAEGPSRPPLPARTRSACAGRARPAVTDAVSELTPFSGAFLFADPSDDALVFTSYETGCRYRVTVLRGACAVEGCEDLGAATRSVVLGSDGAGWEAEVREVTSQQSHGLRRLDLRRGRRRQRGRLHRLPRGHRGLARPEHPGCGPCRVRAVVGNGRAERFRDP